MSHDGTDDFEDLRALATGGNVEDDVTMERWRLQSLLASRDHARSEATDLLGIVSRVAHAIDGSKALREIGERLLSETGRSVYQEQIVAEAGVALDRRSDV